LSIDWNPLGLASRDELDQNMLRSDVSIAGEAVRKILNHS
jgi:hypothetical protein